jgi:hypothetical protein
VAVRPASCPLGRALPTVAEGASRGASGPSVALAPVLAPLLAPVLAPFTCNSAREYRSRRERLGAQGAMRGAMGNGGATPPFASLRGPQGVAPPLPACPVCATTRVTQLATVMTRSRHDAGSSEACFCVVLETWRVTVDTTRSETSRRLQEGNKRWLDDVARRLNVDPDTVRRLFRQEPGVIVIRMPRKGVRAYRTLRIPEHVFRRAVTRLTRVE